MRGRKYPREADHAAGINFQYLYVGGRAETKGAIMEERNAKALGAVVVLLIFAAMLFVAAFVPGCVDIDEALPHYTQELPK